MCLMNSFAYYYVLQNEARKRAIESINKRLLKSGGIQQWDKLTLCSILGQGIGNALGFAMNEWPKFYGPDTHEGLAINWDAIVHSRISDPDHFNLAIWQEIEDQQVLVALAIGNPSHARTHLTVKWIERFYGHTYLGGRALWPILTCAEEYAKLLGCKRVLIKDPVDSGKYERYGYAAYRHPHVAHGGCYLGKDVE